MSLVKVHPQLQWQNEGPRSTRPVECPLITAVKGNLTWLLLRMLSELGVAILLLSDKVESEFSWYAFPSLEWALNPIRQLLVAAKM